MAEALGELKFRAEQGLEGIKHRGKFCGHDGALYDGGGFG